MTPTPPPPVAPPPAGAGRARRSSPTVCIGSPAATCRSPSSSRITSSCSRAGESEARGLAVMAETKRLIPNKRIKYVVNTHPHFDHASGLPPFAADGLIVLTDDNSQYFVEQALRSPRTLVGDVLAKSRKKPKVEGVIEKLVLQDERAPSSCTTSTASSTAMRCSSRICRRRKFCSRPTSIRRPRDSRSAPRSRRWCRTSSGWGSISIGTSWSMPRTRSADDQGRIVGAREGGPLESEPGLAGWAGRNACAHGCSS